MVQVTKHVRTTIRYDGPALADHEMDVQDLAPALLALADLIQIANQKFNRGQAHIKVLVNADVEQRCFMIDISLIQTILEQAKGFLGSDDVTTAKEIAEWVGIACGGALGLFGFIKQLSKMNAAQETPSVTNNGDGNVTITGNGHTFILPAPVYALAQEPKAIERAKTVIRPLEKEGYSTLSFMRDQEEIVGFSKDDAEAIRNLSNQPLAEIPRESSSTIRGPLRIKSAQYEGTAQWGFLWNGRAITVEMIEKAADWVAEFQDNAVHAPPNSTLDVTMIETAQLDAAGLIIGKPSYKVTEVHSVTLPPQQIGLF